jgi:hypothetical protein
MPQIKCPKEAVGMTVIENASADQEAGQDKEDIHTRPG